MGDLGLIPGLGRSAGEGNGYPRQYSGLETPMDCISHGVTMSRTRLSDFHCGEYRVGFPSGSGLKNPPASAGGTVQSLGQEDPLKEEMATHSSILAWKAPWTEEPGGLHSMGC